MARKSVYLIRYESKTGSKYESGVFENVFLNEKTAQKYMIQDFDEQCVSMDLNGVKHIEITMDDMCCAESENGDYYKVYIEHPMIIED